MDTLSDKFKSIDFILDAITPKVSLNTFVSSVSDGVDEIILSVLGEGGVRYIGGKCHFSLSYNADFIMIYIELYYEEDGGRIRKQEYNGRHPLSMINEAAKKEFMERLNGDNEMCIEIYQPDA